MSKGNNMTDSIPLERRIRWGALVLLAMSGTSVVLAIVSWVASKFDILPFTQATAVLGSIGFGGVLVAVYWLVQVRSEPVGVSVKTLAVLGAAMVITIPAMCGIAGYLAYPALAG